jgi:alpha-beta hydrolase superfamily lysophospholipase
MSAQPFYLDGMLALFHPAAEPRGTAVLLCPLSGWEDTASYRARYDWAERLAAAGHPALRFDLPGTGDSAGGPDDPGRLEAWTAGVDAAARWLAHETGGRVAAVGIGLGGLLALGAAAAGAPIDELALWGVPSRGRTLLRELRAFARIEASTIVAAGAPEPPPLPDGVIAPGGLKLSAETTAALQALEVGPVRVQRALLLERDGLPVDPELRGLLADGAAEVTVAAGEGYGTMVGEPALSRAPGEVIATVERWLAGGAPLAAPRAVVPPQALDTLDLGAVRERPLVAESPSGRLLGILAEPTVAPAAPLTAVLLNAGAMRRIGPNRMWVEIARRWAARGVPTLRVDFDGLGDSEGVSERFADYRSLYTPAFQEDMDAVLAALEREGRPPAFAVAGLCSGGHWAFRTALEDPRVAQALLLNAAFFFFDEALEGQRTWVQARRRLLDWNAWRRLVRGEYRIGAKGLLRALVRRPPERGAELARAFDRLRDRGARLDLIFCEGEPLREELEPVEPLDRWPNVGLELVPGRDHLFRPLWMHEHFHAAADRALERALDSQHASADRAAVPAPVGDGRPQRHP